MKVTKSLIARLKSQGFDGLYWLEANGEVECGCPWNLHEKYGCPLTGAKHVECYPGILCEDGISIMPKPKEAASEPAPQ
jgi:hypothetical protein